MKNKPFGFDDGWGYPWPKPYEGKSRMVEPTSGLGSKPQSAVNHVVVPEGFGIRWQLDANGWAVGFELVRGKIAEE